MSRRFPDIRKPIGRMNRYDRREYAKSQVNSALDSLNLTFRETIVYEEAIISAIEHFYPTTPQHDNPDD